MISWWTNIPTAGSVSINGSTVNDPAGTVQHHAVTVTGLSAGTSYPYTVTSGSGVRDRNPADGGRRRADVQFRRDRRLRRRQCR